MRKRCVKMDKKDIVTEYIFSNIKIGDTEILFCGNQQCLPNHFYGPNVRSHFLMIYVHSGKGTFRTQNAVYHLERGSTFFIFPREITYYQADTQYPWEYSWIAFNEGDQDKNGGKIKQSLLRASITQNRPIHITKQYHKLDALYHEMFAFCKDREHFIDIKISSLFLDIIYQYIVTTNQVTYISRIYSPISSYLDLAIEYIKCYYHNHISVSDVAAYLGISREYLCNLFKKQFGISPVRFIRDYRLKSAAVLLTTTNYSIANIAEQIGYNDYNYFSNQFTKLYGISPNRYRKNEREHKMIPDPYKDYITQKIEY